MKKLPPLAIIGALFFIFGFVTWLNATLIPYLQLACELTNFQSMLVTFAFYIAYFFLAIPSGFILERTGFKRGMSLGLLIMAMGALIFIPGAVYRSYPLFLAGLFILGAGLALLQTASNPYAAIIGPPESAAKRISIMGVCNKIAGGLAPLILGSIVLKDADKIQEQILTLSDVQKNAVLDDLAMRAVLPYLAITLTLIILAFLVKYSNLPDMQAEEEVIDDSKVMHKKSIWQHHNLIFGVIALFFYVGIEVIAIDTLIGYGRFNGFDNASANILPSYAMIALIIGYFIGIATIPKYLSQRNALLCSVGLGLILILIALFTQGSISVYCIVGLGLANALVWPSIWGIAIKGLGKYTSLGSSLLIMAIAGGATLPLLYGYITDITGTPQTGYWIGVACYLIIGAYALFVKERRN